MNPLFIVFEGIDGSGSTTQAALLRDYFIENNQPAILSPEPSDGVIGQFIRKVMQEPILLIKDPQKFDEQMAYLFAADRHYHLYNDDNGVFKSIHQDHCHVITTRYYFSSLAYNGYTDQDWEFVRRLNQNFPNPDLVIYLDIPVEVSLRRMATRKVKEVYETETKLQQVRQNYRQIFQDYQGKLLPLEATKTIEDIHHTIVNYLKHEFGETRI